MAGRDKGFHHFIFPDIIVYLLERVEVEILFVLCLELQAELLAAIAKPNSRPWEGLLVRNSLVEINRNVPRTRGNFDDRIMGYRTADNCSHRKDRVKAHFLEVSGYCQLCMKGCGGRKCATIFSTDNYGRHGRAHALYNSCHGYMSLLQLWTAVTKRETCIIIPAEL